MYIPTLNEFQICRKETRFFRKIKFDWYPTIINVQDYISIIGTILSFLGYFVLFLAFHLLKEMRNTGDIYILILVAILCLVDVFSIGSNHVEQYTYTCKWLGIISHALSLLLCEWTIVFAIQLLLQFTKRTSSTGNSKLSILKKLFCCFVVMVFAFAIIISLDHFDKINFEYSKNCWIGSFYPLLFFYFIPLVLVYLLCIVCLSIIVYQIYKQKQVSNQILNRGNQSNIELHKIAIKLMIILGVSELFGMIQIAKSDLSENELIFNVAFGIVYELLRSSRGFLICLVYLMSERAVKMLKKYFSKKPQLSELNVLTKSSTV